jgi:hypothetical protein
MVVAGTAGQLGRAGRSKGRVVKDRTMKGKFPRKAHQWLRHQELLPSVTKSPALLLELLAGGAGGASVSPSVTSSLYLGVSGHHPLDKATLPAAAHQCHTELQGDGLQQRQRDWQQALKQQARGQCDRRPKAGAVVAGRGDCERSTRLPALGRDTGTPADAGTVHKAVRLHCESAGRFQY